MKKLVLLLAVLWTVGAAAQDDHLSHFGGNRTGVQALPANFQILVWNIHKGTDPIMAEDFIGLGRQAQVALFEEAIDQKAFSDSISWSHPEFGWTMAKSFDCYYICQSAQPYDYATGVATGSIAEPVSERAYISAVTEPIFRTPKSFLISTFHVEGSAQDLTVVNMHAINFVSIGTYDTHLNQLVIAVRDIKGPMVIAGDFNTWNWGRYNDLQSRMKALGLTHVDMGKGRGFDHVFVRGLDVLKARELTAIKSSDHTPLLVDLRLTPPVAPAN